MKKTTFLLLLTVLAVLFTACKTENFGDDEPVQVKKEKFGGYAQKGPFVNGSSVTISELDANLNQTGKTYFTTISDNLGNFEQTNIELVSNYIELKADGYYFNEVLGQTSAGHITLYALVDIRDVNSANVNILTHLEKPRVEYLVKQGMSFPLAKKQAQREVLAIFGFAPPNTLSETLNLTLDTVLLAISAILQGYLSTGDMMELMANISADIKTDGILNNTALGSKLMNNAFVISSSEIRNNLINKYNEFGLQVNIPDIEPYIQAFLNSNLYPQTTFITYPTTGREGANILSDDVTSVIFSWQNIFYSMVADVPPGFSLKIVLRGGYWAMRMAPLSPINWTIGQYNEANEYQEFIVTESGKTSDLSICFSRSGSPTTIEYYENGATTPTKVKRFY